MNEPHEIEPEKIVAPAVHFDDGRPYVHQPRNIMSGYVIAGFRHAVCLEIAHNFGFKKDMTTRRNQGFITSYNRFVSRAEGFEIAKKNGQILKQSPVYNMSKADLTSEDLW